MKISRLVAGIATFLGVAAVATGQPGPLAAPGQTLQSNFVAAPATNSGGPRIQFANPIHDFGKVKSGDIIKYSYFFTNSGDLTLDVTHVQPSCGCTAATNWTRRVEPGQSGSIPIEFNSANFSGPVLKTITVISTDKLQPSLMLQFKGTVWKPIEVSPMFAVLNVPPDSQQASTVVKIVNRLDEPITLSPPESNYRGFKAELSTNEPGKEFLLTVSTVPPMNAGSVQGQVTLKTSTTNAPAITVTVWANVQAPVLVMPPQVTLPGGPLVNKLTPAITIQNNSTNALKISDAAINLPGIEYEVKELVPGKTFSIVLSLQAGFEIPAGQQVIFTAKSSNPAHPDIRVPIIQLPRPAQPPVQPVHPALAAPVQGAALGTNAPQPAVTASRPATPAPQSIRTTLTPVKSPGNGPPMPPQPPRTSAPNPAGAPPTPPGA